MTQNTKGHHPGKPQVVASNHQLRTPQQAACHHQLDPPETHTQTPKEQFGTLRVVRKQAVAGRPDPDTCEYYKSAKLDKEHHATACLSLCFANQSIINQSINPSIHQSINTSIHQSIIHHPSSIIIRHHPSSSIIIDHRPSSSIIVHHHPSSSIIVHHHPSSSIIAITHLYVYAYLISLHSYP